MIDLLEWIVLPAILVALPAVSIGWAVKALNLIDNPDGDPSVFGTVIKIVLVVLIFPITFVYIICAYAAAGTLGGSIVLALSSPNWLAITITGIVGAVILIWYFGTEFDAFLWHWWG
jgi:hypothetical protein